MSCRKPGNCENHKNSSTETVSQIKDQLAKSRGPKGVRAPTDDELKLLHDYVADQYLHPGLYDEEIWGFIHSAGIAVIEKYITDCPGYGGRVMVVVWPAGPGTHEVFTFKEDGSFEKNPAGLEVR